MTIEAAILNTVKKLPEPIKQEALRYIENLAIKYEEKNGIEPIASINQRPTLFGAMSGTFALPLSDGFDEPLECFEDYT